MVFINYARIISKNSSKDGQKPNRQTAGSKQAKHSDADHQQVPFEKAVKMFGQQTKTGRQPQMKTKMNVNDRDRERNCVNELEGRLLKQRVKIEKEIPQEPKTSAGKDLSTKVQQGSGVVRNNLKTAPQTDTIEELKHHLKPRQSKIETPSNQKCLQASQNGIKAKLGQQQSEQSRDKQTKLEQKPMSDQTAVPSQGSVSEVNKSSALKPSPPATLPKPKHNEKEPSSKRTDAESTCDINHKPLLPIQRTDKPISGDVKKSPAEKVSLTMPQLKLEPNHAAQEKALLEEERAPGKKPVPPPKPERTRKTQPLVTSNNTSITDTSHHPQLPIQGPDKQISGGVSQSSADDPTPTTSQLKPKSDHKTQEKAMPVGLDDMDTDVTTELISVTGKPPSTEVVNQLVSKTTETQTSYRQADNSTQTYPGGAACIFFSTENREGAVKESRELSQALQCRGFEITCKKWSDPLTELKPLIVERMHKDENCPMMFMCIMGHGGIGQLKGTGGSSLPVNDVIQLLQTELPANIPLVLMIQFCQAFDDLCGEKSDSESDAKATSPPLSDSKYIEVQRENTVLMLAAGIGSKAKRGAFTGAVAAQIRALDEKTDIHTIFTKAAGKMRQDDPLCKDQRPEFRSTMFKSLKL